MDNREHLLTIGYILTTMQKLLELSRDVLPHPPYSSDLAPSNYHLFRSLQHYLDKKTFKDFNDLKLNIENFFNSKSTKFYEDGIKELPVRWQWVLDHNGDYYSD